MLLVLLTRQKNSVAIVINVAPRVGVGVENAFEEHGEEQNPVSPGCWHG